MTTKPTTKPNRRIVAVPKADVDTGKGLPNAEAKPPAPPMSEAERARVKAWGRRADAKPSAPKVRLTQTGPKSANMEMDHPNGIGVGSIALMTAAGTTEPVFAERLVWQILNTIPLKNNGEVDAVTFNGALAGLAGIAPTDEAEAMLAAQMVATHTAAMDMLRQSHMASQLPYMVQAGGLAVKLLRTYTAQLEALNRYRGKGQQKVTVEHVHVHNGGQAIVGAVAGPGVGASC